MKQVFLKIRMDIYMIVLGYNVQKYAMGKKRRKIAGTDSSPSSNGKRFICICTYYLNMDGNGTFIHIIFTDWVVELKEKMIESHISLFSPRLHS